MASTDCLGSPEALGPLAAAAPIRALVLADLPGCLALSGSAGWNQDEADWRMLLDLGKGWAIDSTTQDGAIKLAASVVVVPYSPAPSDPVATLSVPGSERWAWVSMVLVLPEFRRLGYATHLLRHALAHLKTQGATAVLDATPAGFPVYLQEGFKPTWGFRRYFRERIATGPDAADSPLTRAISGNDWPAIAAFDLPAFGADRGPLLRKLAGRLPGAARLSEDHGRINGFILGRDGRDACQIGPLVADDSRIAQTLLDDVLNTVYLPVYVDLADRHPALLQGLVSRGFLLQRPFTRMVHGAPAAPGDPTRVVLVAGPELG